MWVTQTPGTLRASPGLYRNCFYLDYQMNNYASLEYQVLCMTSVKYQVILYFDRIVNQRLQNSQQLLYILISINLNPLQTNGKPLYLKPQSVPRCKHFSSRL
jgi:hypothetical protein